LENPVSVSVRVTPSGLPVAVISVVGSPSCPEVGKREAVPVAVSRVSPAEAEASGTDWRVPVVVAVRAESEPLGRRAGELEFELDVELEKKMPARVVVGVARDAGVSVAAVSVVVT
jgi:hypothetical protein